jgi:protein-L-isoaspartate(D-aspartate) O-methyltransferase
VSANRTAIALDDYRRFYAEEIAAVTALQSSALMEAFAKVPREHFLGPGPWGIAAPDFVAGPQVKYRETEDADPRRIYHNVAVMIDRQRNLNNGHPSTLAAWLDRLEAAPGEHVFHVGAGPGYYTAILSELVGAPGRVTAIEVDANLATRARKNLEPWPNVDVHAGDGGEFDPGLVDAIFVNAGVTHPHALWLDRLSEGGRLLLPLTFDVGGGVGKGVMMLIRREGDRYPARFLTLVMIYSSSSVRDAGRRAGCTARTSVFRDNRRRAVATTSYRESHSRRAVRAARLGPEPELFGSRHTDSGPGDRREHGDFQFAGRHALAAAALRGGGPNCGAFGGRSRRKRSHGIVAGLRGLAERKQEF